MLDLKANQSSRPGKHYCQAEPVKKSAGCEQAKPADHCDFVDKVSRLLIYLASFFLLLTIAAQCMILLQ